MTKDHEGERSLSVPRQTSLSDRPTDRLPDIHHHPRMDTAHSADQRIDSHASGMTATARPARVGKLGLDQIRMSLTARDLRIVAALKQHRFLTTSHLERLHFDDHATPLSAARSARRVLAKLKSLGVITSLPRSLGGVRGGSSQYVWHLTPVGERLGSSGVERRVREPSTAFLEHELGIASIHVDLVAAERAGKLRVVTFTTEPSCWRPFPGIGGQLITLKPDFFAVVAAHEEYDSLVFGEYDRSTESLKTIARKASVYESYWRTDIEVQRSGGFPRVLWIASSRTRLSRIRQHLGRTARVTMALHGFSTPEDLVNTLTTESSEVDHA